MRRLFWLGTGAVLGVTGYRKVGRLARAISASGRPAAAPRGGEMPGAGTPADWARGAVRFARDVHDGMELYTDRHRGLAGRTLEGQQARARRPAGAGHGRAHPGTDYAKDGR
jgi:hypothetical protein